MVRCALIYMGMMTLWCALGAALGALPGSVRALIMGYAYGLIGLSMNAVLLGQVSRQGGELCLNVRGWGLLFALPLTYLPPLAGVWALWRYADANWQALAARILGGAGGAAAVAAGLCTALLAVGWVFCAIGCFVRLAFLRALRGGEPLEARTAGQLVRQALRHSLAPGRFFLRYAPFFLLAGLLWLALRVGAGFAAGQLVWMADGKLMALSMLAYLLTPERWLSAAAFALGAVWMLGAGVYFWPRYQLARVCYFCRIK